MNFRTILFLSIVSAVVAAAFIEAGLDFVVDRVDSFAEHRIAVDMERYGNAVEAQLRANLNSPVLSKTLVIPTPLARDARYRILRDETVLFESSPPLLTVEEAGAWREEVRHLSDGYRVELAVAPLPFERLLTSSLLADIIDLPLFIVLGVIVAWLLGRVVMRPVRTLTEASEQLAAQRFPEPMDIPPGNDELSMMTRSFNRMTAQVRGFIERERTFTRYASHELRTPLSAMKAQVESAQMGLARAEEVWPALERNIGHMEEVLEALLALARAAEHDREEVELMPLLQEVVATLPPEQRTRVDIMTLRDGLSLLADRRLTFQAVRNLLDNALRYSPGRVTVEVGLSDGEARITVRDEGDGVPEAALEHLAEPFFRAEKGQGLGLGLSLVDSISRSLGGRLEFRNTEPGFEAAVTLPILADRSRRAAEPLRAIAGARPD